MNKWNPATDMPDLAGKVALVTGGTSGIGYETVKALAHRGAKVYFTSRFREKAQKAKEALLSSYPQIDESNVEHLSLDLFNLRSIDAAARELRIQESKLDILINNSATSSSSDELVYDKWEEHMAANYIGPFLLVNRLLPLLQNAAKETGADVRIINLSSFAQVGMLPANFQIHFNAPDCLKRPVREHPWQWKYLGRFLFSFDLIRYAVSKAAVACFAKELQRRLDDRDLPILSIAVHPGEVATEGLMEINNLLLRLIARASFLSSEDGATTSLFAATAGEVRQNSEEYKGKFLVPFGKIASPHPVVENDQQVERLWETTTSELDEQLAIEQLVPLEVL